MTKKVIPWNRGLKGVQKHSEETKKRMSETRKGKGYGVSGKPPWNKGLKTGPRSEEVKEKISNVMRKGDLSEWKQYRNKCFWLTEVTYREYNGIINPNNHPRTIAGVDGGYQLDHIRSVKECFDLGLSPEYCSRVENLQMLPWKENRLKGSYANRCDY